MFSFTFCANAASESKDDFFEDGKLCEYTPPLQQFWGELMMQGHVRFDVSYVRDFEELFDILFGMAEEDEKIEEVIDVILQQLNMERLIQRRQDSNDFLIAAAKRGNLAAIRDLLGYKEDLKPHHWAVLRSFEYAALYNQTHVLHEFLNLRFGQEYVLMQDNINTALAYACEKDNLESIEIIESHPRHPSIPYSTKIQNLEDQK